MELTLSLLNTFVVVAVGLALTYLVNDRSKALGSVVHAEIEKLRAAVDGLRAEVDGLRAEVHSFRAEGKGDVARLEARMDAGFNAVRSDLTRVALAVGAG